MLKVTVHRPVASPCRLVSRIQATKKRPSSEDVDSFDRWTKLQDRVDALLTDDSLLSEPKSVTPTSIRRGVIDASKLLDGELPHVAIVGRPNVGKSALVNRLTRSSTAIVFDKPGVTRDRLFVRAFWRRAEFMLMDTGGLPDTKTVGGNFYRWNDYVDIPMGVELQVAAAVEESDCVMFVVDGAEGPVDGDAEILSWLRKQHSDKPVVLAVNKCEDAYLADYKASLFWELGLQPHPVSAISGLGTGDLLDALLTELPSLRCKEEKERTSVAIIGRPNTGKSSLLNALVGRDRAIVSPIPGTTRDAIDCRARLSGGDIVKLVDTAGIRRRTAVHASSEETLVQRTPPANRKRALVHRLRSFMTLMPGDVYTEAKRMHSDLRNRYLPDEIVFISECALRCPLPSLNVESMMVNRSMRALRQCNVAILMIDCFEGIRQQDAKIVDHIKQEGCALIVVANKFDLLNPHDWDKPTVAAVLKQQLREAEWAKVVVMSVKEEHSFKAISKAIIAADESHSRRWTTSTINGIIQDAVHFRPPPASKTGKKGRVYYSSQVSSRPPTFVLFVNSEEIFEEAYKKYIERYLRENLDLEGTPVRIVMRGKKM